MPKLYIKQEGRYLYLYRVEFYNTRDTGEIKETIYDPVRYDLKEKVLQNKNRFNEWQNRKQLYKYLKDCTINGIEAHPAQKDKKDILKFHQILQLVKRECSYRGRTLTYFFKQFPRYAVVEEYIQLGINYSTYDVQRLPTLKGVNKDVLKCFSKSAEQIDKDLIEKFTDTQQKTGWHSYANNPEGTKMLTKICQIMLAEEYTNREIGAILKRMEYRMNAIIDLVKEYNYDLKSLLNYLTRYLWVFEDYSPSDSIGTLRDYYKMASEMGRNVKKYPKYLKSVHDIISANYRSFKKDYDEILFKRQYESYFHKNEDSIMHLLFPEEKSPILFTFMEYIIKMPDSTKEVIDEGVQLNHCVSSYVDRIIEGHSLIIFLRKKENPEEAYITVEVDPRYNLISQSKGHSNNKMEIYYPKEYKVLEKFAKTMNLKLNDIDGL